MQARTVQRRTYFILWLISVTACVGAQPRLNTGAAAGAQAKPIWASHPEPPAWYTSPPDSDGIYDYFVGHSGRFAVEPAARDEAMSNAVRQFVRFCGVEVKLYDEYLALTTGKTSAVLVGELSQKQADVQTAKTFVTSIKPKEWYLRRLSALHDDTPVDAGWEASVLIMAPVGEKAKVQEYAQNIKRVEIAEEREKYRREVEEIQSELRPALDLYLKAQDNIPGGDIFGTIRMLDKVLDMLNRQQQKPQFAEARQNLSDELSTDRISLLREALLHGISLAKVSGDGQSFTSGQKLPQPLVVKAVCNYAGREITVNPAEIEFRLDGNIIEKAVVGKDGLVRLAQHVFNPKYYGNLQIVARLSGEAHKEAYFNIFLTQPAAAKEQKLGVKFSFIYEDRGTSRQMWDGMSLRSKIDSYHAYFSPEQDCYIYIYQVDSSGAVYQIFPNPDYSGEGNPVRAGKDYWVPSNDRFYLDEVTGEEKIYLFSSRNPATELESLFARLRQTSVRQEVASIQGQIKGLLYTRGIGGTKPAENRAPIAKFGVDFGLVAQEIESLGPEFMYCLTFKHIRATD